MTNLIADSGSTKTDWRLRAADGSVRALHTDGFNPYYQTAEQIAATLRVQLLAQLDGAAVSSVFFYGAGCSGPGVNGIVKDALQSVLTNASLRV